ncbi:MAG: heme exporter protein CcmD [Beijerinckiaceae bacterium]
MLDLGRHGGFILASYAATVVIVGGLVWQTVAAYRAAKRKTAEHGERTDG